MNRREHNQLMTELKRKAFPPRPRPLKKCGYRNGQPVFIRKRDLSYFQLKEWLDKMDPKPFIYIDTKPARKRWKLKWHNHAYSMIFSKLYDWLCDKLFS